MAQNLYELLTKLRTLSELATEYIPDDFPVVLLNSSPDLKGFGHSKLTLAVHKETQPVDFAHDQAAFMMHLGEEACPRILSVNDTGYVMEYLEPLQHDRLSLCVQEQFLIQYVWGKPLREAPFTKQLGDESWRQELEHTIGVTVPDWALDEPCLIHGDPTLDNTLITRTGYIRIADPIPPHRLLRPSIRAIDHSKMLQSFLGWEVVLRGSTPFVFSWPKFMSDLDEAKRATFWCMVALKRIALRDTNSYTPKTSAGKWANRIGKELEQCVLSF